MLNVYLSGEIHTNWRDAIIEQCAGLGIDFSGPVTDHALSDDCGPLITGPEEVYTTFNENFKPLQPVGNNDWELDSSPFESAEVREPKKRKANDGAAAPPAAAVEAPAAASTPSASAATISGASNQEGKKARIDMTPQAPKKTAAVMENILRTFIYLKAIISLKPIQLLLRNLKNKKNY